MFDFCFFCSQIQPLAERARLTNVSFLRLSQVFLSQTAVSTSPNDFGSSELPPTMLRCPVVLLLALSSALAVKRKAKGLEKIGYIRHQFGMELGSGYDSPNDIVLPNLIAEEHRKADSVSFVKDFQLLRGF